MADVHDLRSYIDDLTEAGQVARVTAPVSLVHELADVGAALARSDTGAGLFENVTDSPWPIFCGGVASHRRAAIALGCGAHEIVDVMERVLDPVNGVAPVRVDTADWQANGVTGDDVDTDMLPIPTHSRGDGGAFITGAVTVAKDPISSRGNLGYNRMLRLDRKTFGFNVNEWRDVGTFWKSRDDPDAPFPIALAIGLDPAIMIAAGVKTPVDELFIAGAIRGQRDRGVPRPYDRRRHSGPSRDRHRRSSASLGAPLGGPARRVPRLPRRAVGQPDVRGVRHLMA